MAGRVADRRGDRGDVALLLVRHLRPAGPQHAVQPGAQVLRLPGGGDPRVRQVLLALGGVEVSEQHATAAGAVGGNAAPGPWRRVVGALQPVDVDDLVADEHADLHGPAGLRADPEEDLGRGRVQLAVQRNRPAELEQHDAEPVTAGVRVLLDEPFRGQRRDQPVHRGLPDAEPPRELGDADRALVGEEGLE